MTERERALREAAKICREYAHSGQNVYSRQVAYACERRILAAINPSPGRTCTKAQEAPAEDRKPGEGSDSLADEGPTQRAGSAPFLSRDDEHCPRCSTEKLQVFHKDLSCAEARDPEARVVYAWVIEGTGLSCYWTGSCASWDPWKAKRYSSEAEAETVRINLREPSLWRVAERGFQLEP